MKEDSGAFLEHIRTLFDAGALGGLSDSQLIGRFAENDRATAEMAFTVLVKRHGPMVYRACRAILREPHAAEDAFQATFLVLARKARGLWVRDSLGPWLLAVAGRVSACARADAARRRAHEREAAERTATAAVDRGWDDRAAVVREELGRLPDRYRSAVLLCDLEGMTQEEAACHLGWPAGTVRSRLARGRRRLREQLTRRGIAPAAILAGPSPTIGVAPDSLVQATVEAALRLGSGRAAIGVRASVITLTEGAMRMMSWSPLKTAATIVTAGTLLTGTGLVGYQVVGRLQASPAGPGQPPKVSKPSVQKPDAPAPAVAESPELVAIGKARVEVARRMRDATERLWRSGETSLVNYLSAQKRYDEIEADFVVKTDVDRIRFIEGQVASLKRIEQAVRKGFDSGLVPQMDVLNAELARLDAEYALAKFRAKAAVVAK